MNPEEELYQRQMQQQSMIGDSQLKREHLAQIQQTKELEGRELSLAETQLDLKKDLKLIENLLRGKTEIEKDGEAIWIDPEDPMEAPLSEKGIKYIINTLKFYTSKNHLLSNYGEEIILVKVHTIGHGISDELFMRSETYFNIPDEDYCKRVLIKRLKKQQQGIMDSAVLEGKEYDKDEIWNNLISEIKVKKELEKIKETLTNDIYKTYFMIVQKVNDFIHSTYNRALGGQERKTLRQHSSVFDYKMPIQARPIPQNQGMFGWLKR
jgi:hypothetical protein